MKAENTYNEINDFLQSLPESFSILEEEIDIEVQLEYFENQKKKKKIKISSDDISLKIGLLNIDETSIDEKKDILVQLAGIEDVKAYRGIENFSKSADDKGLKSWSILALQESRMLMESMFLEKSQVFISTGLGGRGNKLRYFIVGYLSLGESFTESQKRIIEKEFNFTLEKYHSEIENIEFEGKYILITALIPIKEPIKELLHLAIQECVNLGLPLSEHFLVTNVKKMPISEIETFINEQISFTEGKEDHE